jgi:hypothetical protein
MNVCPDCEIRAVFLYPGTMERPVRSAVFLGSTGQTHLKFNIGIVSTNSFSIDMYALTGKAGNDPIVSFFLLICMP